MPTFSGIVTALSPISHSAGSNGINTEFRRQKYMQHDGTFEMVPEISGNAMRGMLRDAGMLHMCEMLGYGKPDENGKPLGLSLPAFHLLFSGGSLGGKASKGIDIDFARTYREMIPLLSVFGSASGNQMLDGKLKMGSLRPICQETARVTHPVFVWQSSPKLREKARDMFGNDLNEQSFVALFSSLVGIPYTSTPREDTETLDIDVRLRLFQELILALPSIHDIVDEEMNTRKDDEKRDSLRRFLSDKDRKAIDDSRRSVIEKKNDVGQQDVGHHQQMRYFTEVIATGTQFEWHIELDEFISDIEYEAFWAAMGYWGRSPHVGGKSGTGHGKIAVHFSTWRVFDTRATVLTEQLQQPLGSKYISHLLDHGKEIREVLENVQ